MKLQTQPNRWSCLPTSFSMVTDVPLLSICNVLKHDGSEILWPDRPEPLKRRGFHIEEMQYVAYFFGFCVVPYCAAVNYAPSVDCSVQVQMRFADQLLMCLSKFDGILLGTYVGRPNRHAVAWNAKEERIYDPSGHYSPLKAFSVEAFQAVKHM